MGRIHGFLGLIDGRDRPRPRRLRAPAQLQLRHHVRPEQRVRLRLPARQHEARRRTAWSSAGSTTRVVDEVDSILIDEARTPLIISGPAEAIARPLRQGRPPHPAPQARGRLHRRREGALGDADRRRRREDGEAARRRQPLRGDEHPARPPRQPGAARAHALQAQRQLPRRRGQGRHRRRAHRPQDAGPPLERWPPPGDRGEGRRRPSRRRTRPSRPSRSRTTSACTRSCPA